MARNFKARRSFTSPKQYASDDSDYSPSFDKNPFYRTMDIFNGVFKKNIKLAPGQTNATNMHTIFVNFGERTPSKIRSKVKDGRDGNHTIFLLECGHEWEGKSINEHGQPKVIGSDWGMCGSCSADQIYRGFEHEWQHIIFKSDLAVRRRFCEQYADQLLSTAPQVDREKLVGFLSLLVNAFDDLRVNSLWEKVYPGSAHAIWDRWRVLALSRGAELSDNFLMYIFAVAFKLPTDQNGKFEATRPVIEWATQKVKYRGFANMLIDVKVVLDRCMGTLLAGVQPPPPPKSAMQPPPFPPRQHLQVTVGQDSQAGAGQGVPDSNQQSSQQTKPQQGDSDADQDNQQGLQAQSQGTGDPQENQRSPQGSPNQASSQGGDSSGQSSGAGQGPRTASQLPSAKDVQASNDERSKALDDLMDGASVLDEAEEHQEPTTEDLDVAYKSQAAKAAVARAINQDISDLDVVDQLMPTGEVDKDMQNQIDQLMNSVAYKSEDSQLTGNAKARILIIDVTNAGTPSGDTIEIDSEERFAIQRMRSAFHRSLGREKAKRSSQGNAVDVQALIQYKGDHQDANVFENDEVNQGFAYSVLCDMSGSMDGTFPQVARAAEMLKRALHFPFVIGNLWGFRGGGTIQGRQFNPEGEVWMYRYAKDVTWYTGSVPHRIHPGFNGMSNIPVKCGGITPMNSALHVVTTHLWRKMPVGMAKRLFLLTDGSPMQTRTSGESVPEYQLRHFVANEIHEARKHGVQVFTIVIGKNSIDEDKCLQMFGPRKFWRRVGAEQVGAVLSSLVLANFSKYIKSRG